jgi:sialate O-acetylesterase
MPDIEERLVKAVLNCAIIFYMKKIAAFVFPFFLSLCLMANVSLPKLFGDNMVLQRNQAIPVWGWAAANEKITVLFNKQVKTGKADKTGKWQVKLDPETAGGPYELTIKGTNEITVKNILVGEVWICSGQSNMEMQIAGWGKINNYQQEIAAANYPQIRQIKVPNTISASPKDDISGGEWKICEPSAAGDFTAVGYFFARELYKELKVPIGLINTSWGGTHSETWTSKEALLQSSEFKDVVAAMNTVDLEAINKQRREAMMKKIIAAQGSLEDPPVVEKWKDNLFDDSHWPVMKLPGLWEGQGFPDLDGIVWFRKTISIDDADAGKAAILELAKIDDIDETYVNGIKAGSIDKWDENRKYSIPPGILKAGKNVIAVRVKDTGGGGGIYGEASDMQLTIGKQVQSLAGDWFFRIESLPGGTYSIGPNSYPSLLFNAMIHPLIPFAIRGAIWYQGEANAGRAYQYRTAFPLMIKDWRQQWKQGDFPFLFVQLSSFNAGNGNSAKGSTWAELREAQTMTLSLPNTGMAVTTDIGDARDIHPKNKQDVGKRLAAIALNKVYEQTGEYSGPVYQSMKIDGSRIILSFEHTGTGWLVKDKYSYIKGFEIAGSDKQFHYAKAYITGDKIVVYQEGISQPAAVRYAWADDAGEANLFNKEGFPVVPFRTDEWTGITEKIKYTIGQ